MKKFLIICVSLLTVQLAALAQTRTVTGTVISAEDNLPVIGAAVLNLSVGDNVGTITDVNGQYSIKVAPGQKLSFSFIGLQEQEIVVGKEDVINVTMQPDAINVDDVVIVGYGSRKKGTVTGSVSTVGGESISSKPVVSFDQALQGQVAGVQIVTSSGEPTAGSSVKIRGTSSLGTSTAPLYIMDGVVISSGDFTALNSSDIENITVLKDASATSIYGARAANGVIVITSKQAKYGEAASVKVRAQYGVSKVDDGGYKMMNSRQMLEFEKLVGYRTGNIPEELLAIDVNWTDVMYHVGQTQNYEISYSGGSEKATTYVSGSYFKQEGITKRSGIERYSFRSNNQIRINNWLKMGANVYLGYSTYERTQDGGTTMNPALAALVTKPYLSPWDKNGKVVQRLSNDALNPYAAIDYHPQGNNDMKVVASAFVEINPIKNMTLRSLFGIDGYDLRTSGKSLPSFIDNQVSGGNASESFGRGYRLTWTNTLNYNLNLKSGHNLTILLGEESLDYRSEFFRAANQNITDSRLPYLGAGNVPTLASGGYTEGYRYLSFFGRAEYNYDYKYFVDASIRADGSSRFAPGKRWGTFWAVGAMWDMGKEKFLTGNRVLTTMQINASVGTTGNSEIGYYDYMSWVNSGPIYNGTPGMAPSSNPGNPDLTWEKVMTYDFGLRFGFINRINLTVEGYHKVTSDMLMSVPISAVTGYSTMTQNIGQMSNTGVEIDINGDIVNTRSGFVFNLGANFAYNHNKLLKLYDGSDEYLQSNTGTKNQVGRPYGSLFMTRYAGVNAANGDALWYDKNGNVVNYASTDDAVFLDKTWIAPWSGGFTATLSYKGIELSAFFNWVADKWILNNTRVFTENSNLQYVAEFNQSADMLNMWQKPGDITDIPRYDAARPDFPTDMFVEDASFLRLKNVTLSYQFPSKIVKKMKLQNLKVYAQGQNLFTWTKFKGFDPEDNSNLTLGRYPTSRMFTVGIDIAF